MRNVSVYLKRLKRFLGLTRSGASVAGEKAVLVFSQRETPKSLRRSVGVALVGLITAIYFVHSLSNIGGNFVLAINSPRLEADATTLTSVQKPIEFTYESRGFSWFHPAADLVAETGTPVHPIMSGEVELVGYDRFGYGNHVIVKHDLNYESLYAHLSKVEVKAGEKVGLTTELGLSGSTGFSTGPHLHLEIHQNGNLVNPADIVPGVH